MRRQRPDPPNPRVWTEYDAAADWCAKRGLRGVVGDPLPELISQEVATLIDADPEAFEEHVRMTAYANAMNALNLPEE
jgi:hypothetical protein